MVKKSFLFLAAVLAVTSLTACKSESPKPAQQQAQPQAAAPAETPHLSGTVVETMNAAGYTYVQVDTGEGLVWAAAPQVQLSVGDVVALPPGQEMHNMRSNTLDREFETILFVPAILVGDGSGAPQEALPADFQHPEIPPSAAPEVDFEGLSKAEGGYTVAEVYARKDELAGQAVSFRGKVVRFNPQIMGVNWLHIQDGTGGEGSNDITVTSDDAARIGDTVLINGTLALNKDLGYGYHYEVLVENASVSVE